MKQKKTVFIEGPIPPDLIVHSITKLQTNTNIGAHDIFLGQVRADHRNGKTVTAITYEAYTEMAATKFHKIKKLTFEKFDVTCIHIYHSHGKVKAGEICLFVCVSAPHRKVVFEAMEFLVNTLKKEVPIFGKELFEDDTHVWKINT